MVQSNANIFSTLSNKENLQVLLDKETWECVELRSNNVLSADRPIISLLGFHISENIYHYFSFPIFPWSKVSPWVAAIPEPDMNNTDADWEQSVQQQWSSRTELYSILVRPFFTHNTPLSDPRARISVSSTHTYHICVPGLMDVISKRRHTFTHPDRMKNACCKLSAGSLSPFLTILN